MRRIDEASRVGKGEALTFTQVPAAIATHSAESSASSAFAGLLLWFVCLVWQGVYWLGVTITWEGLGMVVASSNVGPI